MTTKPQIYATGIHASFLKTLSIYYYFLFFLLNSVAKKILRNTSAPENLFMQNKPNFRKAQINVTSFTIASYEDNRTCSRAKAKPIQTQSNPIQTQFKPKQTQFRALPPSTNPQLPKANNLFFLPECSQFLLNKFPGSCLINPFNRSEIRPELTFPAPRPVPTIISSACIGSVPRQS